MPSRPLALLTAMYDAPMLAKLRLLPLLLAACTSRPLGDDGGSSGGETGPPSTTFPTTETSNDVTTAMSSDVTTASPSDPVTTTSPGTIPPTTDPTIDPESTSVPGTTDTPVLDFPDPPDDNFPDGLWLTACPTDPQPGTTIKGESSFGPFLASRAFLGYVEANGSLFQPLLVILDDSADAELAFDEFQQSFGLKTGPGVLTQPAIEWDTHPFWEGSDGAAGLDVVLMGETQTILAAVAITGHSGNWDVADPDDPPRVQGSIGPGGDVFQFDGVFDAPLCDRLTAHIIAE